MAIFTVETTRSKNHNKLISIRGEAGGLSTLVLPRFALMGPGDRLRMRSPATTRLVELEGVSAKTGSKLFQHTSRKARCSWLVTLTNGFREMESAADYESYEGSRAFTTVAGVRTQSRALQMMDPKG